MINISLAVLQNETIYIQEGRDQIWHRHKRREFLIVRLRQSCLEQASGLTRAYGLHVAGLKHGGFLGSACIPGDHVWDSSSRIFLVEG